MSARRGAGVGATVGVVTLLAAATIGALVAGRDDEPTAPEPAKGSVVARWTAPVGLGSATGTRLLEIRSLGPAPTGQTLLVDADGTRTAVLAPVDAGQCTTGDVTRLDSGLGVAGADPSQPVGQTPWCFQVTLPSAGADVKGVVRTPQAEVTVTASQRVNFWWGPALVGLAGLVGGLVALLWMGLVEGVTYRGRIDHLVARNRSAGQANQIGDLGSSVEAWRAAGVADTTVLGWVLDVVEHLPARSRAARDRLREKLLESRIAADHPIRDGARLELDRTAVLIEDGYAFDANGPKLEQKEHPASTWAAALVKAGTLEVALRRCRVRLKTLPGQTPAAVTTASNAAENLFARAGKDDLGLLETKITAFADALDAVAAPGPPVAVAAIAGPGAPPEPELGAVGSTPASTVVAVAVGVATVAAAVVLALFSLWSLAYEPKPAFGTTADYVAVLTAAVGSAMLATVVAVLKLWGRPGEEA